MGLFDKIKDVARAVTGGGAKVFAEADPATTQRPFNVRIKAVVSDAPLKINGVYLLVKGEEEVRLDGRRVEGIIRSHVSNYSGHGIIGGIAEHVTTCEFRVEVAGAQQLEAKKEYAWSCTVTLPAGSKPTYAGTSCDHRWSIQAGLDAAGNDPDSGWVTIPVT